MEFAAAIAFLTSLFKLIPKLGDWFHEFLAYYIARRIAGMKAENREAIRKAIHEQDQRDIEASLGNAHPGELSGIPGTQVRDHLPGVVDDPSLREPKGS